jgi:hypothetical protein
MLFKEAETMKGVEEKARTASRLFGEIADLEEKACLLLETGL